MNHQDKFWQVFQDKVKSYSTDEYQPAEWTAMEELLVAEPTASSDTTQMPAATKAWWIWWGPALLLLLAIGGLLWTLPVEPAPLISQQSAAATITESPADQAAATALPPSAAQGAAATRSAQVVPDKAEQVAIKGETHPSVASTPQATVSNHAQSRRTALPAAAAARDSQEARTTITRAGQPLSPSEESTLPAADNVPTSASKLARTDQPIVDLTTTAPGTEMSTAAIATIASPAIAPLTSPSGHALPQVERAPDRTSKRLRPSLIVGANLVPTNTGRAGQMAGGALAGLAVRRDISRRWSIEVEAVARAVTNYDLTLDVSDSFINPTGGQEFFHREARTIRDYLSIDFPIVLHYATRSRWSLTTGLRYSYITPIDIYSTSVFRGLSEEVIARINEPQIWQHDFGLLFGLAYDLSPRWSLQLRYTQSWVDLSPDNLYQDTKTHLNSDLQITTRKYF